FDNQPYRVLLTGFGPTIRFPENPSWLAVKPLHNTVLEAEGLYRPRPTLHDDQNAMIVDEDGPRPRQIHITSFLIPVEYDAVLACVPGIHSTPTVLPHTDNDGLPYIAPPDDGYDFILHVGIAGRGPLRMEKVAHKLGYRLKDSKGNFAPVVAAESGFGKGFENFDDDVYTDIDVEKLVVHLKDSGIDQVYTSMDAGHYLCDFLYFSSLAAARRDKRKNGHSPDRESDITKVLSIQIPPVGQPLSSEEVTEAIRRIILWVC
ncbi:peptidase C15, pyroglutamyl peptidase I-like protein, partial [Heliocybe sulcata]